MWLHSLVGRTLNSSLDPENILSLTASVTPLIWAKAKSEPQVRSHRGQARPTSGCNFFSCYVHLRFLSRQSSLLSSKAKIPLSAACLQARRSLVSDSHSWTGILHALSNFLSLSLNRFRCHPYLPLPVANSEQQSCFGRRLSALRISALIARILARRARHPGMSIHEFPRILRRQRRWTWSTFVSCLSTVACPGETDIALSGVRCSMSKWSWSSFVRCPPQHVQMVLI